MLRERGAADGRALRPGDDLVDRAFRLAAFLHTDRDVAIHIATAALGKLDIVAAAQDKRAYYRAPGETAGKIFRFRRKVSLNRPHLLQRLVYIESEPFERKAEIQAAPADPERAVVHFIKHLVQITVKRNSFHVGLAMSRILHSYTTAECLDVLGALAGEGTGAWGEDYCRARKSLLLRELQERFGSSLRLTRGAHGEERLESRPATGHLATLVRRCLDQFTPWDTPCTAAAEVRNPPTSPRREAADGHAAEVERMHAFLHPGCF